MKSNILKRTTLLAFAGLGILTFPAKALTYNNGDLLLGFYSPTAANDIVVDLGSASIFRDANMGLGNLSLGDLGSELSAQFGSNWSTRSDLYWGVFVAAYENDTAINGDSKNTLYAGKIESTVGIQTTGYGIKSNSTQAIPGSKIDTLGNTYSTPNAGNVSDSAFSPVASIQSKTVAGSFATYVTSPNGSVNSAFNYFGNALGNFGGGVGSTKLDLFRMVSTTAGGGLDSSPGSYEGTFSISSTGQVSFAPVPEPATIYVGLLLIGLVVWRKRCQLTALLRGTKQM